VRQARLGRERSSFPVAGVDWGGYHYGNAYFRNVGVLLFGFGPDLLLIFFSRACRLESHPLLVGFLFLLLNF
jgi:hypothetical protein